MRRICCTLGLFFCTLILISFSACGKAFEPAASRSRPDLPIWQLSFRDIPGVTAEEILAIEELQKQGASYTVSVPYSTELFIDVNGEAGGYTPLLCQWLSALFEIPFQPQIEQLGIIAQKLNAGDAGFSSQAITVERQARYFLSDPVAQRSIRIMRLRDSQSISVITQSRPPRYVFLEGAMMIDMFADTPGARLVAADYETAYRILLNGEADAFLGNNTMEVAFDSLGGVVTEDFFPLTFIPIALATGNQDLAPIISVLTKALRGGAYSHLTELYRQGYREYRRYRFFRLLTEEEREYIRDNPVIPFATQYQSYPISFYNRHEMQWEGVVFDVLDEMEGLTGFAFELVNGPDAELPELLRLLENGTAYFIPNLVQSDERRERFIWPDTMYIHDRYALLSKRNFPNVDLNDIPFARVGLHRGSAFTDMFRSWFPNAVNAVEYPSSALSFQALDHDEVDLVMSTQSRLAAMTNLYELSNYKVNFLFSAPFYASFGINRDQVVLASIVDKALILIDTERIMEQWQSITYDYQARLMREQRRWLIGLSILAMCVLALVSVLLKISRSSGKKLETLVKERTNELELRTEEANAASQSKTSFLANMSHEIRTPMNAIIGITELLLSEDLSGQQFIYVGDIKTSAMNLLDIINDILDISKIQTGKLSLLPVHYDFSAMVDSIGSMAQFLAANKDLSFQLRIHGEVPRCLYGDDIRLRQVLLNLLSNAIKFTKEGYIQLFIDITHKEVVFAISDTGAGIPEDEISRLFVAFEQVDVLKNRNQKGTGLGLSISKALVELMDGQINVESLYGQGSIFSVVIPKIIGDETQIKSEFSNEKIVYAPEAKILVVDDNTINLNVVRGLLQLCKISVDTVESGREAIECIKENQYDLVFMDQMMPEMDGIQATKIIREMGVDVPIIALTANAIIGAREMLLDAGMNDFLSKPIIISSLHQILRQWLPQKKLVEPPEEGLLPKNNKANVHKELLKKIEKIEGLSVEIGLERVSGQSEVYEASLKLLIREIEKGAPAMTEFLASGDLNNFNILVHSMKSSLANLGVMELSEKAKELEFKSHDGDRDYCEQNLPSFLEELLKLGEAVKDAYHDDAGKSQGPVEIPEELREIFIRISEAFGEMDILAINKELESLESLDLSAALDNEIEPLKDAILMMDYDAASEVIKNILNQEA